MELWIARDKDGTLYLYDDKPTPHPAVDDFVANGGFWRISRDILPQVTWENSPQRVRIEIMEEL